MIFAARHQVLLHDEVPRQGTGRRTANRRSSHESTLPGSMVRRDAEARGAPIAHLLPRDPKRIATAPLPRSWTALALRERG